MSATPDTGHRHEHDPGHDDLTGLLDLDADVLHAYWAAALDWVRDGAAGAAPARVADLGAGTGTGAIGLAQRFPAAEVIAVDITAHSLRLLDERAAGLGLASRLRTVVADLDAGWPALGPLGLTWASMSLHHLADPAATLRQVLAATASGGLIAVAEFREPLRFLPADLGTGEPGFEDRALAALGQAHAAEMPALGTPWSPRLADAGWQVVAERDFPVDLPGPAHPRAGRYATAWFSRLSDGLNHGLAGGLDAADRGTLAALLDAGGPHSLLRRTDLRIRGTRSVTLGRRG